MSIMADVIALSGAIVRKKKAYVPSVSVGLVDAGVITGIPSAE